VGPVPNITLLLQHGLFYGTILSVLMGVAFISIAFLNPEIWLPDYPPDIRQRFGPMSQSAVTNSPTNDHLTAHIPRSEVAMEGSTAPWVWPCSSCPC
jgi:hypothetical protein